MKPIDTIYNGYRFRSRLEARWAVFFDKMGIPFEYENEGYDLDGLWYLPDFWIPCWNAFVEIKPGEMTEEEIEKCRRLNELSENEVLAFCGEPFDGKYHIVRFTEDGLDSDSCVYYPWTLSQCGKCSTVWIVSDAFGGSSLGHPSVNPKDTCRGCDDGYPSLSQELIAAFTAARQSRFEHNNKRGK